MLKRNSMKKIVLSALVLLLAGVAQAQGIKFFDGSFEQALKAAESRNKMVFLEFHTSWCVHCRRMAAEAFTDAKVAEYFNSKFICLKIDAESQSGKPVAAQYAVAAFPTLVITDARGEEIASVEGAMNAEQLLKWGQSVGGDAVTFEQLYEKQKAAPADDALTRRVLAEAPDFLGRQPEGYQYERWLLRIERLYDDYRKRKPLTEWMNPEDFKILTLYHTEPAKNDEVFEYIASNYASIVPRVGAEAVNMFLVSHNMELTQQLAEMGDMDYMKRLERVKGDLKPAYDAMLAKSSMDSYTLMKYLSDGAYTIYNRKDVAGYISLMDEYLAKLGKTAVAGDYSSAIQVLYDALDGKLGREAAGKGVEWITKALQFNEINAAERMELLIMNGDCYKKLEDKDNAVKCYKQAYALSLQFENPSLGMMIQNMIDTL